MSFNNKIQTLIHKIEKKLPFNKSIFTKYFTLFAIIFLITLTLLGSSVFILVNNYASDERTNLLKQNTASISSTISSTLIMQDMNYNYSMEKALICETLATVSQSIDADIFVCDVGGNIIMCMEKASSSHIY